MQISSINPALSTVTQAKPGSVISDVGIQMLDKAIEMNEDMMAGTVKMMEMSVNPSVGGNFDASI